MGIRLFRRGVSDDEEKCLKPRNHRRRRHRRRRRRRRRQARSPKGRSAPGADVTKLFTSVIYVVS